MSFKETWNRWMGNPPEGHSIDKMKLWGTAQDIGEPVHAGVFVSQESALRLSVVWRCIRLISETLAGLPVDAIRKRNDFRETVDRPPGWLEIPNPESTWFEFAERVFESLCMDGNAFILITSRDAMGFPSELWTLHPSQVKVTKGSQITNLLPTLAQARSDETMFVWNGKTVLSRYGPTNPTGDVLHVKLASAGGLRGMSPIEAARQSIGLGLVTEKFGARFFGHGQQMSGVIQLPADQPARSKEHIELMRATWESVHGGSDASHRPGILTGGATWQGITIPPEDAQFLQTRAFQVEDIASRFYGIPPHLVGLTEKQTSWGTGVEQQGIGLYRFTLRGWIVRFEMAMSQLLPRGQYLRLNPRALLEADSETEAKVLQMELQNGVINRNHWRAILDLPPVSGGDQFILPLNFQILTRGGQAPPTTAPSNGQQVPQEVSP